MPARLYVALFILQNFVVLIFSADDCISLHTDATHIQGKQTALTLKCQLEQCNEVNNLKPQSLRISKIEDSGDILLASIQKNENVASRAIALGEAPKVTGDMKDNRNTYLAIQWADADRDLEGQYTCDAILIDKNGKKKSLDARTYVVVDDVGEPTRHPSDLNINIEMCKQRFPELNAFTKTLDDFKGKVAANFFRSPLTYNNKKYYMSLQPYVTDVQSDDACGMVGGYLAEINDANEYQAIVEYLKSYNNPGAMISGTDAKKEGVWIYQRSQMPVRFFFWGQKEPNNANGGEDCMIIWPLIDYLIVDASCVDNTFWKFVYVCEVDN